MNKDELKDRIDKVDERTVNLFKRYPIVGGLVFIAGYICGVLMGWWLL